MADIDAETAFLNAQEADQYGSYSNGDVTGQPQIAADEEEDDYDPSNLMPDTSYTFQKSPSEQSSASISESTAQSPPAAEDSMSLKPKPVESSASTKRPQTMGGFVVESEDEEDELPITKPKAVGSTLLNVNRGSSSTPQRSLTETPNTLHPSNVPLHSAAPQEQGLSGVLSTDARTIASAVPNAVTPAQDSTKPLQALQTNSTVSAASSSLPKARLPNDRVGQLEDRIAEDPRGDMDAWLSLISEHRKRNKFSDARAVYDRFFKVFPTAAEEWANYVNMESELDELRIVEQIFNKCIATNPSVELWSTYLDYVRRRNNLVTDSSGNARQVINSVYQFILMGHGDTKGVGMDRESGRLWLDYFEFLKSGPGTVGGNSWQDMQKMDTLRKIYRIAVQVPTREVQNIWNQYNQFEMGLNRQTARKFLQETSPAYMTARACNNTLENITRGLVRTTRPKLPPALGFDGDTEYMAQVELWKKWISWEKEDPLILKDEDPDLLKTRILYAYKQALMALRFWPEMWYDAAEYCFQNEMEKEGMDFLTNGIEANPESCLLAFKKADRIELKGDFEEGEDGGLRKGEAVREPFNKVLDALYALIDQTKKREELSVRKVKESSALNQANAAEESDSDDEEDLEKAAKAKEEALQQQIRMIQAGYNAQSLMLKKTISYIWIALMRTMRRIQGRGSVSSSPPGFRGTFAEARRKGKLTSDVYIASALIEHYCYQDIAAGRIFEKGMKLFPEDENFALEYIKHLVRINDITNARAVFETIVSKLTQKEAGSRAKALFAYIHDFESQFGELSQITKLEERMSTLFPEDPQLARFSQRFSISSFDPTAVRPIISPATQMRPKMLVMPSIEEPQQPPPQQKLPSPPVQNSPRPIPAALLQISNSPKRPLEESDNEAGQPRKIARGESPLKGAAGRRLDAARRNMARASEGTPLNVSQAALPQPLPREINFLLSIIPGARTYRETRFNPERMVALLRDVDLSRANTSQQNQQQHQQRLPPMPAPPIGWPAMPPQMPPQMSGYGYPR